MADREERPNIPLTLRSPQSGLLEGLEGYERQNVIESLMRSADQALRDSCARLFDGLSEMIRDRAPQNTNAAGVAGFGPGATHDPGDASAPHNQASHGANA